MQTCTRCQTQSPDSANYCVNCGADLSEFSKTAVTLKRYQANPRIKFVYVMTYDDCCPTCREIYGAYPKETAPKLPVEGCSNSHGCRCFYQPFLEELTT